MFEINLVPDVKAQLLGKQRMRNLVIFVAIVVAMAAAAVVLLLGSIVTGQNIVMANQDREMKCRSTGSDDDRECPERDFGTAILRIENINEFLTIQDQMNKIATINDRKMLLSRVFGVLDVILPTGDDEVRVSELSVDLANATLNFDAQGDSVSNIDYRALEVFKNVVRLSYYDHGRYMRYDNEAESFVEIPTTCIDEVMENNLLYGVYHRGMPGCETSVLSQTQREALSEQGLLPEEENASADEDDVPRVDVKILRDYRTVEERETYMSTANEADGVRYYFESSCVEYGEDGRFDEMETRATCPLSEEAPNVRDSSNGRDSSGNLVLRFSSTVSINKGVFGFINKHMRVIGPTRQNVTDSYTQIRDMFTERARNCSPEDPDYAECMKEVPNGD